MKTYQEIETERNQLIAFKEAILNPKEHKDYPLDLFKVFDDKTDGKILNKKTDGGILNKLFENDIKKAMFQGFISPLAIGSAIMPVMTIVVFRPTNIVVTLMSCLIFSPIAIILFHAGNRWNFEKYIKYLSKDKIDLLIKMVDEEINQLEQFALSKECRQYNKDLQDIAHFSDQKKQEIENFSKTKLEKHNDKFPIHVRMETQII